MYVVVQWPGRQPHSLAGIFRCRESHSAGDADHTLRNSLIPRPHGNEATGERCSPSMQTNDIAHITSWHHTLDAHLFDVCRKVLNQTKQGYGRPRKNIKHTPANTTTICSNCSNTIQPCFLSHPAPGAVLQLTPYSLVLQSHPAPGAVLQLTATPYSLVPSLTQPLGLCSNSQQHHTALFSSLTQPLGLYTLLYLGWTSIRFHMSFIKYYSWNYKCAKWLKPKSLEEQETQTSVWGLITHYLSWLCRVTH